MAWRNPPPSTAACNLGASGELATFIFKRGRDYRDSPTRNRQQTGERCTYLHMHAHKRTRSYSRTDTHAHTRGRTRTLRPSTPRTRTHLQLGQLRRRSIMNVRVMPQIWCDASNWSARPGLTNLCKKGVTNASLIRNRMFWGHTRLPLLIKDLFDRSTVLTTNSEETTLWYL